MRLPIVAFTLSLALTSAAIAQTLDRASVEDFWKSKGAPAHVAAGIADNVKRESNFDPTQLGDGGTSAGLYQMHNERFAHLLADMQNDSAWKDVMGRDPIAAAHWDEIVNAPDRRTASRLWARWFERCAACSQQNPQAGSPLITHAATVPVVAARPLEEIALHQWHDGSKKLPPIQPHEWHREQN